MANEPFSTLFTQSESLLAPLVKANQRAVADMEKLAAFQMKAWQAYVDLGLDRLKAATEVRDPESLQTFLSGQFEAAGTLARKWMEDAQALAKLCADFQAEFNELAKASAAELGETAAKTVKKTTEAARKSA